MLTINLILNLDGPSGMALVALTFAQYVVTPFYAGCYPPPILMKLIAYAVIIALTVLNAMLRVKYLFDRSYLQYHGSY